MEEHKRKSAEGEKRKAEMQELLRQWSADVGVPPALMHRQMPIFYNEWGFAMMQEAFAEMAAFKRAHPRTDSQEMFRVLIRLLRSWRKAARGE